MSPLVAARALYITRSTCLNREWNSIFTAPLKPPGPWGDQASWWSWWAFHQPSRPETLNRDRSDSDSGNPLHWWASVTQGVCRLQVLIWGWSAPSSHRWHLSTGAACSSGAIGTVNYSQKDGSRAREASKTAGSGYRSALAAGCSLLTALYIWT